MDGPRGIITVSPGRLIFASPSFPLETFDAQLINHEYTAAQDPRPEVLNERVRDLGWLRQRFGDFAPEVRRAVEVADSAFKWRLVEVDGLREWSSGEGRVVLLGDACESSLPIDEIVEGEFVDVMLMERQTTQ